MHAINKSGARTEQVSRQRSFWINVFWVNLHEFGSDVGVQLLVQRQDLRGETQLVTGVDGESETVRKV